MLLLAIALLASVPAPASATASIPGDVLVVDAAGGGDYLVIQSAVNAALEGDIVLVRGGSYASFSVIGIGLTVIGDNVQPRPLITGTVSLRDLPDGQTLVLSGFEFQGSGAWKPYDAAIRILDCEGTVRVQDSQSMGRAGSSAIPSAGRAVAIINSADVAITSLTAQGGAAFSPTDNGFGSYAERGGDGIYIETSKVAVQRCLLTGGAGGSWTNDGNAGDGGTGLFADYQVELVLVHALLTGGAGGDSGDGIGPFCAVGGNALVIGATQNDARGRSLTLVPGGGGTHVFYGNTCSPGNELVGPFTLWDGNARSMLTPSLVRANESVTTTANGQPGDLVWRWINTYSQWERRPAWRGTLLVKPYSSGLVQLLGSVPGDGSLEHADRWRLPSGMQGITFHTQALFRANNGQRSLSNASAITVLDPAF